MNLIEDWSNRKYSYTMTLFAKIGLFKNESFQKDYFKTYSYQNIRSPSVRRTDEGVFVILSKNSEAKFS